MSLTKEHLEAALKDLNKCTRRHDGRLGYDHDGDNFIAEHEETITKALKTLIDAKTAPAWQKIETAPNDGDFYLYGLTVSHSKTGYSWFEYHPLRVDDEGSLRTLSDDHFSDWQYSDFTHWTIAPPTPPEKTS